MDPTNSLFEDRKNQANQAFKNAVMMVNDVAFIIFESRLEKVIEMYD